MEISLGKYVMEDIWSFLFHVIVDLDIMSQQHLIFSFFFSILLEFNVY